MNHLQLRVQVGTIAITWSSQGLLKRIDWYCPPPPDEENREAWGESRSELAWNILSKVHLPPSLGWAFEGMRRYLTLGEPLGPIRWDAIDTRDWTDFQIQVYRQLCEIPHGETRSYAWVARRLGRIVAPRAVGQALKRNPLPILIPCHRIIASSDALGGFMGITDPDRPEVQLKRRLIEIENTYLNPVFPFLMTSEACG